MTAATATVAELRTQQLAPREQNLPAVSAGFFDLQSFELIQRVAKAFASSALVPKEYQGNVANCMIALNLAQRLGADPLMVMQNLYLVHGRPAWSAQFLIATANMCGRFSALRFEFFGDKGTDGWGCRAWAMEKATEQRLSGSDVTIALAKKEGWYAKNGSKWQTMPQQMLMYRAGSWWVRAYAPELSMGLMSADELHDVYDATRSGDGSFEVTTDSLREDAAPAEQGDVIDITAATEGASDPQPERTHNGPSAAEVEKMLRGAKSQDLRDQALDMARGLPEEPALRAVYDELSRAPAPQPAATTTRGRGAQRGEPESDGGRF